MLAKIPYLFTARAAVLAVAALSLTACSKDRSPGDPGGGGGGGPFYGTYGGGAGQPPARTVDGSNPDNAILDTDCDGISDAEEIALGTNPSNPDSDGDGITDGVELGRTVVIEPARCTAYFVPDADPAGPTTNPLLADSDGDGVNDGAEDANGNGRLDPGESDPGYAGDAGDPTVAAACSPQNLAPVAFDRSQPADVQEATRGFAFREMVRTASATEERGWIYWNAADGISAFALKKGTIEASASAEETAGRAKLVAAGGAGSAVSNPLVQTFTTWDGYAGVKATYNWTTASRTPRQLADAIAIQFAGADAAASAAGCSRCTAWPTSAGVAGTSWVLQVEYVWRANASAPTTGVAAAVAGAFVPAASYTGATVLKVDDVANGSAFAQADDTADTTCDVFETQPYSKLDILWVVDNSGSMADHQTAVKNAGDAIAQALDNTQVDWRMGLVTTAYYGTQANATRDLKAFSTSMNVIKCWFDQAYNTANPTLCTGGNTWVTTGGTSSERGLLAAKNAIQHFLPAAAGTAGKLRPDAKLVLIFLSDTDDQDTGTSVPSYEAFFADYDGAGSSALANGVLCQDLPNGCGDNLALPLTHRIIDVVNDGGGILASISDFDTGTNTVATLEAMIRTAAGATSRYTVTRAPISASLKVALEGPTLGTCGGGTTSIADVPRSRANGFDYYAPTRSLVFYGACRPVAPAQGTPGSRIALSYRYWVPGSCPAEGCPYGCVPACGPREYCDAVTDPNNPVCICSPDCGGTCNGNERCDPGTCACIVPQG